MSGLLTPPRLEDRRDSPVQSMTNISTAGHGHEGNGSGTSTPVPSVTMSLNPYPLGDRAVSAHPAHHSRQSASSVVPLQHPFQASKPLTTKVAKQKAILRLQPPPDHWLTPSLPTLFGRLHGAAFNVLCLMSVGYPELGPLWAAICFEEDGDESMWADATRQITERTSNTLVMAGLLLSSAAAFITTEPPRATVVNYTLRGPYLCILGSTALLGGGIVIGCGSLFIVGGARPSWVREVLGSSRFHVYCTLIMVSYPFFSITFGTSLLAFGLVGAVWCAEDRVLQTVSVIVLILPVSMVILFGVLCATAKAKIRLSKT